MIIPTNKNLLNSWQFYLSTKLGPHPKVPFVHNSAWREIIMYEDGVDAIQLVHRREISAVSKAWKQANAIWDASFPDKTEYKNYKDLDWDYMIVYFRDDDILAVGLVEVRCIPAGIRELYRPFGLDPALWPKLYTPYIFLTGLTLANAELRGTGIGIKCIQAVCDFAKKLLAERESSPWANAFGEDMMRIPVTLNTNKGDENAIGFYKTAGFRCAEDSDKQCYGYSSWSPVSLFWLPHVGRETQMVRWVFNWSF